MRTAALEGGLAGQSSALTACLYMVFTHHAHTCSHFRRHHKVNASALDDMVADWTPAERNATDAARIVAEAVAASELPPELDDVRLPGGEDEKYVYGADDPAYGEGNDGWGGAADEGKGGDGGRAWRDAREVGEDREWDSERGGVGHGWEGGWPARPHEEGQDAAARDDEEARNLEEEEEEEERRWLEGEDAVTAGGREEKGKGGEGGAQETQPNTVGAAMRRGE